MRTTRQSATRRMTAEDLAAIRVALEPGQRAQAAMYRRDPEAQLRWVVRFATDRLPPEDAESPAHALSVLLPSVAGMSWQTDMDALTPLSAGQLRDLQREIRRGLERILAGERWALPAPRTAFLCRSGLAGGYQWGWQAPVRVGILLGVADLIRQHGQRLRACRQCQAPFLAVKRQEYCSAAHAQQARDETKRQKKATGQPAA